MRFDVSEGNMQFGVPAWFAMAFNERRLGVADGTSAETVNGRSLRERTRRTKVSSSLRRSLIWSRI